MRNDPEVTEDPKLSEIKELLQQWGRSCFGRVVPPNMRYQSECSYTKLIQIPSKVHHQPNQEMMTTIDKIVMRLPEQPYDYRLLIRIQFAFTNTPLPMKCRLIGVQKTRYYEVLKDAMHMVKNRLKHG
jgi:hypothetical protein